MNTEEQNQVLDEVKLLVEIDVKNILFEIYGESTTPATIVYQLLSVEQFIVYHKKILDQLKQEIGSEQGKFYDKYCFISNGSIDLIVVLQSYRTYLSLGQEPNLLELYLMQLIQYAMHWGFWDKSIRKMHPFDKSELLNLATKGQILATKIENLVTECELLRGQLVDEKGNMIGFISEKEIDYTSRLDYIKSQFTTLESTLTTAQSHANQINDYKTNSATAITELLSNKKISEGAYQTSKEIVDGQTNIYNSWVKKQSELIQKCEQLLVSNQEEVAKIELRFKTLKKLEADLNENQKIVQELLGLATGTALFHKLDDRRRIIESNLTKWFWGVMGGVLLFGSGVLLLWYLDAMSTELSWASLGANALRTLPFALPLILALREYSRERLIVEEYAFKASIAVTLDAYKRMLDNANPDQTQLIVSATKEIFVSPKGIRDRNNNTFNSKHLSAIAKELLEAIKGIGLKS